MADETPIAPRINVKYGDEEIKGRYANLVRITHTREEMVFDFINVVPPHGAATARVITSPGHAKRLLRALANHVEQYEKQFGPIVEAPEPGSQTPVN
ncbi:MAG: DUF3467 domain-containing protein [Acidobacteriota bacterium]